MLGVDLADALLALARAKAGALALENVEFRAADMAALDFPDGRFDAVVSVFSVFFVEDMAGLVRELWRMVRPGGRLAITTWGPRFLEPANSVWWRTVMEECPGLREPFRPWERIQAPHSLASLFEDAGVTTPEIRAVDERQPLDAVEDWWTIVLGSGLRGTVEEIGPDAAARSKRTVLRRLAADGVTSVECNTLHAVSTKAVPSDPASPEEDG